MRKKNVPEWKRHLGPALTWSPSPLHCVVVVTYEPNIYVCVSKVNE